MGFTPVFISFIILVFRPIAAMATVIINFPASESPFEKVAANASSNITGKSQVFIMATTRKNITNHGNTLTKLNPLPLSAYLFFINYNTPIGVLRLTA